MKAMHALFLAALAGSQLVASGADQAMAQNASPRFREQTDMFSELCLMRFPIHRLSRDDVLGPDYRAMTEQEVATLKNPALTTGWMRKTNLATYAVTLTAGDKPSCEVYRLAHRPLWMMEPFAVALSAYADKSGSVLVPLPLRSQHNRDGSDSTIMAQSVMRGNETGTRAGTIVLTVTTFHGNYAGLLADPGKPSGGTAFEVRMEHKLTGASAE